MPTNSDLKRWYKVYNVEQKDFVRYDAMFRVFCYDAVDDFHAVNLGQMNEAIQKAIQSHAYDVKVKKIEFPYGELTSLTYDTDDGLSMLGTTRLTEVDDETVDIETSRSVPIRAIGGLTMDVSEDGKHIEISGKDKSNATNLENGTGDILIQTTDTNRSFKVMTDGRAKVQSAPIDNDDVVRKLELDKKLDKPTSASSSDIVVYNANGKVSAIPTSILYGKLTAPTTPTAESAVTMLADGTVGTKLLSEIGGSGGGKLYVHSITISSDGKVIQGNFLSTRGTNYDVTDDFNVYFLPGSKITINNTPYGITHYANMPGNGYRTYDSFNITTYEESGGPIYTVPTFEDYYVTEL